MGLKPLSCPECGEALKGEAGNGLVLGCTNNHYVGVKVDTHNVYSVPAQLVKPNQVDPKRKLVFLPFWVFNLFIDVSDRKIRGGGVWRFITGQKLLSGDSTMYVCAANLPEKNVDELSKHYSINNLPADSIISDIFREDFNKLPVIMDEETAYQHAHYIFLKNEFDASGTLQWIKYKFDLKGWRLVYLPFYMDQRSGTYDRII
ncbi:hypothetical protein [Methanosarcina sp. UBA289]|uniref:hypothetical protein n=1 Tax=Methanosarcina sp. UBA289 TaxID=1915574 RepID=UPI0025D63081|nr:hypothetical protein [Methanosarcina sp. UBA289]